MSPRCWPTWATTRRSAKPDEQPLMQSTAHDFKHNVDDALRRPQPAGLAQQAEGRLLRAAPAGGRAAARVRGAARSRARHQEPHAGQPRLLSRGVRAQGDGAGRPRPLGADRRGCAPHHRRALPERRRQHRRQVEVDGGSEEIALNDHLEALGIAPIETDLGEYIIQLRHEPPSHIIAPAVHLTKDQVADTFLEHHQRAGLHQAADRAQRPGRRGALRAAPEVPRCRCRPDRRQLPGGRDRLVDAGDQRRQRRSLQHAAARCRSCWPASRR